MTKRRSHGKISFLVLVDFLWHFWGMWTWNPSSLPPLIRLLQKLNLLSGNGEMGFIFPLFVLVTLVVETALD